MKLYLINYKDKTGMYGYRKSEQLSGLVKIVDSITERMTDKTSNLIRKAGECEQIEVNYGTSKDHAVKNYNRIVSSTIKKNAVLLGINSVLAIASYIPPLTLIPLISISFTTMAIHNYSLIAGAKKGLAKAEFLFNEEIAALEDMLRGHKAQARAFCDEYLQELYNLHLNSKSL